VFHLHYEQGLSHAEIGKKLGCSEGNAKVIAYRARQKLQVELVKLNCVRGPNYAASND
jgi:RNA polymerase sigma factor (sigma-70 family)